MMVRCGHCTHVRLPDGARAFDTFYETRRGVAAVGGRASRGSQRRTLSGFAPRPAASTPSHLTLADSEWGLRRTPLGQRGRILEATFATLGTNASSIQAIADRAGMSKQALLHYFRRRPACTLASTSCSPSGSASSCPAWRRSW